MCFTLSLLGRNRRKGQTPLRLSIIFDNFVKKKIMINSYILQKTIVLKSNTNTCPFLFFQTKNRKKGNTVTSMKYFKQMCENNRAIDRKFRQKSGITQCAPSPRLGSKIILLPKHLSS